MMLRLIAVCSTVLFLLALTSCSHTYQIQKNWGLSAEETVQLTVLSPTLIGGVPAEPGEWPASVYVESSEGACSSTLIGSRMLASAAHCVKNGGSVKFTVGTNKYTARCELHPEYFKNKAQNESADLSLCLVNRPVIGVEFEKVATKLNFKVGDEARLTGYGCLRSPGTGGNDGIFRIGRAIVTSIPHGKNYNIVTKGSSALCFGDSGGALFKEFEDGSRELAGINSQGNIKDTSYLASLSAPSMQAFIKAFAKRNGQKVCGIDADAVACRALPPGDPSDLAFEYENAVAWYKGGVKQASKKSAVVGALKKTLDSF